MRAGIPIVGHGSLMSARGLGDQLAAVLDVRLVSVRSRRRLCKPSQRTGCLAMDVATRGAIVEARVVEPDEPPPSDSSKSFEGLLLWVDPAGSIPMARREGYPPGCWRRLLEVAAGEGLATFLLRLAEEADDDVPAYRRALWKVTGASGFQACHYLPHPVRTGGEPAVVFVSPGPGRSGDPALPSAKDPYPDLGPLHLDLESVFTLAAKAYPLFDPPLQARYAELCLLSAAHGLHVADLVEGLAAGPGNDAHPVERLLEHWSGDPTPLQAEREALLSIPGLGGGGYARRFPATLEAALVRSGLPLGRPG